MARINLQKIVTVKGHSGLFHLLNYNSKGYFLQPLEGGQTRFFSNERDKVLAVGNVDLKLKEGSVNTLTVFHEMEKRKVPALGEEKEKIIAFFHDTFPELDRKVAFSGFLKVLKWYHQISDHFKEPEIVNEEDDGLSIV